MAGPNPKRTKMDNPIGQSISTSHKYRKIQPHLIDTATHLFQDIKNMPGFVDHTHFIQSFLVKKQRLAIFAPSRFGKSSHLNMVRQFLEIDVDKRTGEVSSCVNGPAKGRKNYKLFEGTRIITDDNEDLVEDHLGKHPVIYLDLKGGAISSVKAAEKHCRRVVQEAYYNHLYLRNSTKLEPGDEEANATAQRVYKEWCNDDMCMQQDLLDCLKNLARYLYNHFNGAKVYILVDEFDSINVSALFSLGGDDRVAKLQNICDILGSLLEPVAKGAWSDDHVAGVLLTGISYVSGLGYSSHFNNFTTMRFLDGTKIIASDPDFVPFYGATREELESLIQNLVQNKELVVFEKKGEFLNDANELDVKKIMDDVESRYNGYFDRKGTRVYCLWSILQYLERGDAENYWYASALNSCFDMALNCEKVLWEIIKLMRGEMIQFNRRDQIAIRDLVPFYDLLMYRNNEDKVDSDIVFNFLSDLGYLTYPEGDETQDGKFKLPNSGEIRTVFSDMIKDIITNWKIDTSSCTEVIDNITLSLMNDERELQDYMLDVYEELSLMLRPFERRNRALMNEATILCIMNKVLNDAESFELCVDLQIKDAEGRSITLDRPDFLLLHENDKKCSILWALRFNKYGKTDKYTTSLYGLQEARGIVVTKNGKTKTYMDSLKKLGREALVIGLSIDSDIKVSLSYALGMEQKIFFKSETESTYFPILYQTYNPMLLS